jgi:hypothetical protein
LLLGIYPVLVASLQRKGLLQGCGGISVQERVAKIMPKGSSERFSAIFKRELETKNMRKGLWENFSAPEIFGKLPFVGNILNDNHPHLRIVLILPFVALNNRPSDFA